jgi:4-amino-4-deoxy-L-arabinose transferase-like glycosyltransferase
MWHNQWFVHVEGLCVLEVSAIAVEPQGNVVTSRNSQVRMRLAGWGLVLLCLFLFFWRLGSVPLFDLDEALYVTCSRQMALSGDFVTPRLNARTLQHPQRASVAFFEKPILIYWACAGSLRTFGFSEGTARLPSACAALLTTGMIVLAGMRWFGRRAGLLAGLVYATAPMTLVDARQMTTDGLLTLWFTGALFAFWRCYRTSVVSSNSEETPSQDTKRRSHRLLFPLLFWSMCALAVLTKGAIGLLLPFLVIAVFLLMDHLHRSRAEAGLSLPFRERRSGWLRVWSVLKHTRPVLGLLLLFTIAAPWHLLISRTGEHDAQGRTFYREYIIRQHIGRFKGGDRVHNAPLPTYFAYFLLGFFPWACFTPAAFRLKSIRQEPGSDTKTGVIPPALPHPQPLSPLSASRRERGEMPDSPLPPELGVRGWGMGAGESERQREAHRFLLVWFWTIFGFFSLGAAKLPTYIVPAYPAAALLVGHWLEAAWKGTVTLRSLRRGGIGAMITASILLVAVISAPHFAPANAPISSEVLQTALHLTLALFVGSLIAWSLFSRGEQGVRWRQAGVGALVGMMLALIGIGCTEGYTVVEKEVLGPYQQIAGSAQARADARAGLPILFYHIVPRRPSMNYYAVDYSPLETKETPLLPFLRPLLLASPRGADIITSQDILRELLQPELAAAPDLEGRVLLETGGERGWVLLRIQPR